jgi:hypothetical protein
LHIGCRYQVATRTTAAAVRGCAQQQHGSCSSSTGLCECECRGGWYGYRSGLAPDVAAALAVDRSTAAAAMSWARNSSSTGSATAAAAVSKQQQLKPVVVVKASVNSQSEAHGDDIYMKIWMLLVDGSVFHSQEIKIVDAVTPCTVILAIDAA